MNTLIISYDLGIPENSQSYKDLSNVINTLGKAIKPLASFWLVKTTHSVAAANEHLAKYMDINDRWMVIDVTIKEKLGSVNADIAPAVNSF